MCSEDIPVGLVAAPEPSRRRFLSLAGAVGGATTAAMLAGCTVDTDDAFGARSKNADEAIIHNTYTGLSERSEGLTLRKLIEGSDAAAPDNQLRGAHRLLWDVGTQQPFVALSFDDGPDPRWTPRVLDALKEAGAQATFFMMGYNVDQHRELAHRVLDEGHEIGNHTWSHQDLAFQDPTSTRHEIVDAKRAIKEILGVDTVWFRPPRGELSGAAMRILAEENYDTFLWSVSRNVPGVGTPELVADHIVDRLRPGAIIDMHDSIGRGLFLPQDDPIVKSLKAKRDVDVAAVPAILEQGMAAGLKFVTMSALLESADGVAALTPATPEDQNLSEGPTTVAPRAAG
ncbi:MAG TPA: polysaccharide deacetylase family protein [Microthrixaceae bacterium]|jgi:peptidoglycan/xylan/chitin deacetylase (PgdA/CDA1 family)|nr:polysaccharide deacetylase family protein [Microthrixaceae bacterium]